MRMSMRNLLTHLRYGAVIEGLGEGEQRVLVTVQPYSEEQDTCSSHLQADTRSLNLPLQ